MKPTEAEAVLAVEEMLNEFLHAGCVVRTNKSIHTVNTAAGEVIHIFRIRLGRE